MKKVRDGKYLKNYELSYENKAGRLKTYEIVSRKELEDVQDLGRRASGVSIVAFQDGKMLLLRVHILLYCTTFMPFQSKDMKKEPPPRREP